MAPVKATTSAVKKSKFVIDCSGPANDKIFDAAAFVSLLSLLIMLDNGEAK